MTTPLHEKPVWVPVPELGSNRFDPLYYDPTLTVAEHYLRSKGVLPWKRLRDVSTDIYSFGAYELTNSIRFVEPGVGTVPFVNVTEIANPFVEYERARHIDPASHELLEKSVCRPGTLLLSMSGSIGRVGVLPAAAGECNSNQHVAKIIVEVGKHDAHFLAAYFTTNVGQASCEREAAGAVQKELYLYNISTLPVPDPPKDIRLSIGHKIRVAEQLKASASQSWSHVRDHVRSLLAGVEEPPRPAYSTAFVADGLASRRIDADYYRRSDLDLRRSLKKAGFVELGNVCATMVSGSTPRRPGTAVRIAGVGSIRVPTIKPSAELYHLETGAVRVQCGDVLMCNAAHDASFIGRMSGVVGEDSNLVASSEVLVCRPESAAHSLVIVHFLNTRYGYVQIQRAVRGMTAHLYAEDMAEVLVPAFKDEYSSHEAMLRELTSHWREAEKLTASAIADVENLIKGKLNEDQCLGEGRKLAEKFGLEVP